MSTTRHDRTPEEEQINRWATHGAAMQLDRMFEQLPILHHVVTRTPPGQSIAAHVQRLDAMTANGTNGEEPPRELPDLELPEVPAHDEHKTPKARKQKRTIKHPRGHQRNPQTHRGPRKRAAPVLEERGQVEAEQRKPRRKMSRAERARISARMREYWATRGAARRAEA